MLEIINRRNYERFLIDFADGTLSAEQHAMVVSFLKQNPDIANEFYDANKIELKPDYISYGNVESLKKNILQPSIINRENYEYYFINYKEGDLSEEEKIQVENFIETNPDLKEDFDFYSENICLTHNNEIYPEKENLKRIRLSTREIVLEKEFNKLCVAAIEGDINSEDKMILKETISKSKEAFNIFNTFKNTKLLADTAITYPNKEQLKKKNIIKFRDSSFARASISIAAAIGFAVIYYLTLEPNILPSDYKVNYPTAINIKYKQSDSFINRQTTIKRMEIMEPNITKTKIVRNIKSNNIIKIKPLLLSKEVLKNTITIDIQTVYINYQEQFVNNEDSGYYLVLANNNNNIINKVLPSSLSNVIRIIKRTFIKEKEEIKAEPNGAYLMNVAQLVVTGFNKMTENNIAFNRDVILEDNTLDSQKNK